MLNHIKSSDRGLNGFGQITEVVSSLSRKNIFKTAFENMKLYGRIINNKKNVVFSKMFWSPYMQ